MPLYHPAMFRLAVIISIVLITLGVAATARGAAFASAVEPPVDPMPAAGSATHAWFLLPGKDGEVDLMHHAADMKGPGLRTAMSLRQPPAHLAAFGDRLWLVYEPSGPSTNRVRHVYTVRAIVNRATGLYFNEPARRLELLENLPGAGRLAGLAASARGPIALLAPASWRAAGVEAGENSIAAEPGLATPQLLELRPSGWLEIDCPADLTTLEPVGLAVDARDQPVIFATDRRPRQRDVYIFRRASEQSWTRQTIPIEAEFIGAARVQDQLYLLLFDAGARRLRVKLLRDDGAWPVGEVTVTGHHWAAIAIDSALALIERGATVESKPTLRTIDPLEGAASAPVEFTPQAVEGATRLYMPFILGLIMTVILLIFVLRPVPAESEVQIAPHVMPLDLGRRMVALLIDAIPGVIVAALVTGIAYDELTYLVWWAMTLVRTEAVATCAAVTVAHGMIGEMIWGRSLGKLIVGGQVVTIQGGRPGVSAVIVRNMLKFITMTIPALAVFVLVSHTRQGMGELLTKTVVASSRPATEPEGDSSGRE